MILLYHLTHFQKIPSIMRQGLLPEMARGNLKCIWLSSEPDERLAEHVARNHNWAPGCVIALPVTIHNEESLIKHHLPGLGAWRDTGYKRFLRIDPVFIGGEQTVTLF